MKCHRLIRADANAAPTTSAQAFIHHNGISLAVARFPRHNGGRLSRGGSAFFPFRDGVDVGLREGVTSVIQPGGSENDYQSIEACNEVGATMVYTGQRSFKH